MTTEEINEYGKLYRRISWVNRKERINAKRRASYSPTKRRERYLKHKASMEVE